MEKFKRGSKGQGSKQDQTSGLEKETESIFDAYDDLLQSEQKTSAIAIEFGNRLNSAKTSAKKQKVRWKAYCDETLSDIESHEIRDCMCLASRYKKNPWPGLLMLKRTNLIKFFRFCKGKPPKIVLSENNIDLISKNASGEEIKAFGAAVRRLYQSGKKKKASAKSSSKGKAAQQSPDETDPKANTLKYYRRGLLQLIEKDLRKPKGQLPVFTPRAYKNFLYFQNLLTQYIEVRAPGEEED